MTRKLHPRARRGSIGTRSIRRRTHHQDGNGDGVTERVLHLLPTDVIVKATETVRSIRKSLDIVTKHTHMWHGHGKRLRQCPGGRHIIRCGEWLTMVEATDQGGPNYMRSPKTTR